MKKGDEWRGESPFGLWRYGDEFITVGRDALDAHRERDPELRDPGYSQYAREEMLKYAPDAIYYNFLHGVELGLKSYLLHVETGPLEKLRHQFGHNIARLLDEALQRGLCSQCPELTDTHIEVIRHSSQLYTSKQFEYIHIGFVSLVGIDQVAEAAETLIAGLKKLPMKPAQDPGQ